MAIRKSKEEVFSVEGTVEDWLPRCEQALHKGGFTNIKTNGPLAQLRADYKKLTVWGQIRVTLLPETGRVQIRVESTANADNVFALFSSPTQKISNQFKSNL